MRYNPSTHGQKRAYKKLCRLVRLLTRVDEHSAPTIIKQNFRDSAILSGLFPNRQKVWRHSWKRKDDREIDVSQFSFIDNPEETMMSLHRIAVAEAECRSFYVNFCDDICLDIGPYMVFGLMRQAMLPVTRGGKMGAAIREVIQAVNLTDFLKMELSRTRRGREIWPFVLRMRRGAGTSQRDNLVGSVTSEEAVATDFVDTVDTWLAQLDPPLEMTGATRGNVLTLMGEVLDNAKRHSDPKTKDGQWAIAGFMERREQTGGEGVYSYVCHLAILSPGASIHQSLNLAPAELLQKITSYTKKQLEKAPRKGVYDEERLWTFYALQDGVSRIPKSDAGSKGGFGMMTLIEMMNEFGKTSSAEEAPRMTIISGHTCISIRDKYRQPKRTPRGHRVLAFNDLNDLDLGPDPLYITRLPFRLAGTIISMRFCLDPEVDMELAERDKIDG